MGRGAPVDPVMAARLAVEAAAAAKAAADAAAAAEGNVATTGTAERLAAAAATSPIERGAAAAFPATDGSPTLAGDGRPEGTSDLAGATSVTDGVAGVAASLAPDLGALAAGSSLTSRLGLEATGGSSRNDMLGTAGLGLPGLGDIASGSFGAGALAGAAPTLGNFSSGGGGIDRTSIMDGGFGSDVTLRQAWDHPILTGGKLLVDAVDAVAETLEDAVDTVHDAASSTKDVVDAVYDYATDDDEDSSTDDGDAEAAETAAAPTDAAGDAPVAKPHRTLLEIHDSLYPAEADGATEGGEDTTTPDAGTTNAEYRVQGDDDLSGNPYAGGYTGLLTGVTGHTGSGSRSPLGPSGGGTVVNPGTEGFAPAEKGSVDLSGAVAYGGGVKDPPKPVDGPAVLAPSELEAAPAGADPGAVDPNDPNASTAASTAYVPPQDEIDEQGGHGRGLGQGHNLDGEAHGNHGGHDDFAEPMDDAG